MTDVRTHMYADVQNRVWEVIDKIRRNCTNSPQSVFFAPALCCLLSVSERSLRLLLCCAEASLLDGGEKILIKTNIQKNVCKYAWHKKRNICCNSATLDGDTLLKLETTQFVTNGNGTRVPATFHVSNRSKSKVQSPSDWKIQ